jgi:hypothetical protein
MEIISSTCFLSCINPFLIKLYLKQQKLEIVVHKNISLSVISGTHQIYIFLRFINFTLVSLNGAFSKLIPPGEVHNINPKSI